MVGDNLEKNRVSAGRDVTAALIILFVDKGVVLPNFIFVPAPSTSCP